MSYQVNAAVAPDALTHGTNCFIKHDTDRRVVNTSHKTNQTAVVAFTWKLKVYFDYPSQA